MNADERRLKTHRAVLHDPAGFVVVACNWTAGDCGITFDPKCWSQVKPAALRAFARRLLKIADAARHK